MCSQYLGPLKFFYFGVSSENRYICTTSAELSVSSGTFQQIPKYSFSLMLRLIRKYSNEIQPHFKPQAHFSGPTPPLPFSNNFPASNRRKPFLEIALVISVLALTFFAVDNYSERVKLEGKLNNQVIKSQQMQEVYIKQMNALRKKRELQILNERKSVLQRQMKMSLHVAMLRKQLLDLGHDPVPIDTILQEYSKSVKMENSISNVSGTALWVTEDSDYKSYVPNAREYDSTKAD